MSSDGAAEADHHSFGGRARRGKWTMPSDWESSGDDYEYVPLRLPPEVTRVTASMRLAIQAEYGGWELSRVRLYTDGSRRVLLRRRRTAAQAQEPGL